MRGNRDRGLPSFLLFPKSQDCQALTHLGYRVTALFGFIYAVEAKLFDHQTKLLHSSGDSRIFPDISSAEETGGPNPLS
ncbi:predicted protein [Botrytis cinerea T4]|uniref:Uncharacterized protein n=1 Tax=Botryotinia fuckeliana (strain T4) TaxID=999810 RepID=G2Y6T9_BOTF4|nr:predicted protein [Botrytis cinerea T4]